MPDRVRPVGGGGAGGGGGGDKPRPSVSPPAIPPAPPPAPAAPAPPPAVAVPTPPPAPAPPVPAPAPAPAPAPPTAPEAVKPPSPARVPAPMPPAAPVPLLRKSAVAARPGMPAGLKWALWLFAGVAVTATAGYLVAALVIFPAPLLPNERQVARTIGLPESAARRALERQGLTVEISGRDPHPSFELGAVIWQDPPAGVAVPRGTMVSLVLSTGVPRVRVPDVRGYGSEFAARLLAAAGLRVDGVDTVDVKGVPPGTAGSTSPAAGDSVLMGRSIFLHLAR